ncbi:uncharacterized protein V1510DRAFT_364539 [Dipodascopsis tothii]|uniref:uncharacterized protein n=1 Tax=Dipodascopsis tothii TaxID=44089 RepID=UPI0034CDE140
MARHVVIALDWDAFYCSVEEKANPGLRNVPFAVRQKTIVCTCNYVARAAGVRKLCKLSEALEICPSLVVIPGEDLSKYRDASKMLWHFVQKLVWNGRVERLGFDELLLDVTEMVEFNLDAWRRRTERFFFRTSRDDAAEGFWCDSDVRGHRAGAGAGPDADDGAACVALASQLCAQIRGLILSETGFTSSGGVGPGKIVAKMVGALHKPDAQTVIFPDEVQAFLDPLPVRRVTGVGSKMAGALEAAVGAADGAADTTVFDVRTRLGSAAGLAIVGAASRLWELFNGEDVAPVVPTAAVPTQISIEDSFRGVSAGGVVDALQALARSLVTRMRKDLLADDDERRWLAYPRSVRVSVQRADAPYGMRISRTAPLPAYALKDGAVNVIAARLVHGVVLALFERACGGEPASIVNVAVVGIELAGADISTWARGEPPAKRARVDAVLADADVDVPPVAEREDTPGWLSDDSFSDASDGSDALETAPTDSCSVCGAVMPVFVMQAHLLFHESS